MTDFSIGSDGVGAADDDAEAGKALTEDCDFITEFVPNAAIKACTSEFINVTIIRTAYARVSLAITFHDGYPSKIPGVELSSSTLPFQLLRCREKACVAAAKEIQEKRIAGETSGAGLVEAIYRSIHSFIHTNLFIPCWKEVKTLFNMCENTTNTITVHEKTGLLNLKLQCGEYKQQIKVTVPEAYPEEGVKVRA